MAFDFGCYISYAHDEGDYIQTFIKDLTNALKAYLHQLDDGGKYWLDEERLGGGLKLPETIASAMCRSACWILVYIPKYRRHSWCQQEYRAMRELEALRQQSLGHALPREQAMIIPILLNGHIDDLPQRLSEEVLVEDFSRYAVSESRILQHPESEKRIKAMAERIWDVWKVYENVEGEPNGCERFTLPPPDMNDWGPEQGGVSQGQPR